MAAKSSRFLILYLLATPGLGLAFAPDPIIHAFLSSKLDDATHTSITESGIKRAVRQYFLEKSPDSVLLSSELSVALDSKLLNLVGPDGDASLTDIFQIHYGNTCLLNLTSYQSAVQDLVISNANTDTDSETSHRTDFHFDAEKFDESNANVIAMRKKAKTELAKGKLSDARAAFGRALHTLQDFYSHSNWVEMGKKEPNAGLGNDAGFGLPVAGPDTRTCKPCPTAQGDCKDNIVVTDQLTSGYPRSIFPGDSVSRDVHGNPVLKPGKVGKCSHGGPLDKSADENPIGGINKDTGEPSASPHWYLHHQAAQLAELTTAEFVMAFRREVGDEQFEQFLALDQPQCQRRRRRSARRARDQPTARRISLFAVAETVHSLNVGRPTTADGRTGDNQERDAAPVEAVRKKNAANSLFPACWHMSVCILDLLCLIMLLGLSVIVTVVLFKVSSGHCWRHKPAHKRDANV